jgi:hypothetical protein
VKRERKRETRDQRRKTGKTKRKKKMDGLMEALHISLTTTGTWNDVTTVTKRPYVSSEYRSEGPSYTIKPRSSFGVGSSGSCNCLKGATARERWMTLVKKRSKKIRHLWAVKNNQKLAKQGVYKTVSKSFRTSSLDRELQMV